MDFPDKNLGKRRRSGRGPARVAGNSGPVEICLRGRVTRSRLPADPMERAILNILLRRLTVEIYPAGQDLVDHFP